MTLASKHTEPPTRRCPYCGCGFEPKTPDQVYCWLGCEAEDRKRRPREADADHADSLDR